MDASTTSAAADDDDDDLGCGCLLSTFSFFWLLRFFLSSASSTSSAVLAFNAACSVSSFCFDLAAGAGFLDLCRVVLLRDPCAFDGVSLCVESSIVVEDDFRRLDLLRRVGDLFPLPPRSGADTSFLAVSSCGSI